MTKRLIYILSNFCHPQSIEFHTVFHWFLLLNFVIDYITLLDIFIPSMVQNVSFMFSSFIQILYSTVGCVPPACRLCVSVDTTGCQYCGGEVVGPPVNKIELWWPLDVSGGGGRRSLGLMSEEGTSPCDLSHDVLDVPTPILWTEWQTDTCENIIFPQQLCWR